MAELTEHQRLVFYLDRMATSMQSMLTVVLETRVIAERNCLLLEQLEERLPPVVLLDLPEIEWN